MAREYPLDRYRNFGLPVGGRAFQPVLEQRDPAWATVDQARGEWFLTPME